MVYREMSRDSSSRALMPSRSERIDMVDKLIPSLRSPSIVAMGPNSFGRRD